MNRFCAQCGNELNGQSKFCPNCGTPVPAQYNTVTAQQAQQAMQAVRQPTLSPAPQTAPKPAKKKGAPVLNIILALILLAEGAVAGFKYPGYFVEKKSLYDGITLTSGQSVSQDGGDTGSDLSYTLTPDNIPGDPSFYDIAITEEDVRNAASYEAEVSPASPVCTVGNITADFKEWNLDGDDKLETRELGTFTDPDTGTELEVYDFSLGSGQSTFFTSVDITLPRPQDGSGDGVVYYDPEKDEWEYAAFDISDDGSSYILHTRHFSRFAVVSKYWNMISPDSKNAAGILYADNWDPYNMTGFDLMNQPLLLSAEAVVASLQESLSPEDLAGVSEAGSFIDEKHTIGYAVDIITGLPFDMYEGAVGGKATSSGLSEAVDTAYSIGEFGTTAVSIFSEKKVKYLSDKFGAVGNGILAARLGYALMQGANPQDILKEYSVDLISTGISASLEALGVSNPIGASVAVLLTATSYFYGDDIKGWLSDQFDSSVYSDPTLRAYQEFLQTNMIYYDRNGVKHPLKLDGTGWSDYLKMNLDNVETTERLNVLTQCFDNYLEEYWNQYDLRANYLNKFNHDLYNYYRLKEAGTGEPVINENYAVFAITEAQRQKILNSTKKRLFRHCKDVIEAVYTDLLNDLSIEMIRSVKSDLLPYMNTPMVFEINDTALKKGETFDNSIYAKKILEEAEKSVALMTSETPKTDLFSIDPSLSPDTGIAGGTIALEGPDTAVINVAQTSMKFKHSYYSVGSFVGAQKSIIVPPGAALDEFYPRVKKGSNTVLECRIYYYLKYGQPRFMNLKGDKETGAEPLSNLPIKFSQEGDLIKCTVTIEGKADEEKKDDKNVVYLSRETDDISINTQIDVLSKALVGATIKGIDSGSFTVSGSATADSDVTKNMKYSAHVTISGKLNSATGKYDVTFSGSVHETYSKSSTWTEDYIGGWSSTYHHSVSNDLNYKYSGTSEMSYTPGKDVIYLGFDLLEEQTGYIHSVLTFNNTYGNSGETDDSGPVDLKRLVTFGTSFAKE